MASRIDDQWFWSSAAVPAEHNIRYSSWSGKIFRFVSGRNTMTSGFPGVGHRYFVDFVAFQVELDFASETSLTYYNLDKNGNKVGSETVTIKVEPITDGIFLVTWQESDKSTVVHIEDYNRQTIVTNITESDLTFDQFHGTFRQLS
jgi:hypothetical protein